MRSRSVMLPLAAATLVGALTGCTPTIAGHPALAASTAPRTAEARTPATAIDTTGTSGTATTTTPAPVLTTTPTHPSTATTAASAARPPVTPTPRPARINHSPAATGATAVNAPGCPTPAEGFVHSAPGSGKTVALTFDDGPGPFLPQILAVLEREHVRATFFDTGAHDAQYPGQVAQLVAAGQLVADHTFDHYYPGQTATGWSLSYLRAQMLRTNTGIRSAGQPVCFFRPPGGFTHNVLTASRLAGMSAVLWSIDTQDWAQPGRVTSAATAAIVSAATDVRGQRHPIVLMHAAKASHEPDATVSAFRGNTVAALPAIIDWYRSHGYRFVDMSGRS